MRRYGRPPLSARRYTPRPGAYAVLLRGRDVLLTHQMEIEPEFQLPGGGIDPGESPVQALHREVYEETGWRIGPPRRLESHRRFTFMPEYDLFAEKVCHVFLARPAWRIGPPVEADHVALWMPVEIACDLVASPGDRAALGRVARALR